MEKQRIIWSRVAHQPLHRPQLTRECKEGAPLDPKAYHIVSGWYRARILLIVRQNHYITAIVAKFL
jgi:hypothetical protein